LLLLAVLAALLLLAALAPLQSIALGHDGALSNPTGRPIGGGEDYGDWVNGPRCARKLCPRVTTKAQLLGALNNAGPGTVVYVQDNAVIDLTGTWDIPIRGGVTLASGRGRGGSLGGLLYTTDIAARNLFVVLGTDVRITGLRLRGPDTEVEPPDCGGHDTNGIAILADEPAIRSVRIDNNEMWGWPSSAVGVRNVYGALVQHNHIHHNRRRVTKDGCRAYGLGYGVVVSTTGWSLVEANLFDHNRHDIATDGTPNTNYEARYNLVLNGAVEQSFDVHGGDDRKDGTHIAGHRFQVHHNTFLQSHKPAFSLRGIPTNGAWVYANEFRHAGACCSRGDAVRQTYGSQGGAIFPPVRLYVYGNAVNVDYFPGWFVSFSGESFWRLRRFDARAMSAIRLGDFDGDGRVDAFTAAGGRWFLSRGAREDWVPLNTSSIPLAELRFGDFDRDKRTDVFRTNGTSWYVSYGGTSPWQVLNRSGVRLDKLAFGDFDGDGRTDVFYADGSRWYVSWAGVSPWAQINTSSFTVGQLRFGDFDGDKRTDVFRTDGTSWYVSYSGTSPWQVLNRSGVRLDKLAFADVNGDRRTDVFYGNGSAWFVSWGGTSAWQRLNTSSLTTSELLFGDFNGDGRADVLSRQHPDG
jgi:hypothetical protein